jgi:hypothetical protein
VDLSVEREADGRLLVKIQTEESEINVRASAADFGLLAAVFAQGSRLEHLCSGPAPGSESR